MRVAVKHQPHLALLAFVIIVLALTKKQLIITLSYVRQVPVVLKVYILVIKLTLSIIFSK